MQTFLPYPDFAESVAVLDTPRLGKQRVETLQLLRAISIPSYGWQNHPVAQMWRGYVPALTRYGLATVDEWTGRGYADSTRTQIAEFAPQVDAQPAKTVATPGWLGNEALHFSHQSNLLRKDPDFYRQHFPGVPDDVPYLWPGTDPGVIVRGGNVPPAGAVAADSVIWVIRPRSEAECDEWIAGGFVALQETSPRGKRTAAWEIQLGMVSELGVGDRVAVLIGGGAELAEAVVVGPVAGMRSADGAVGLGAPVEFVGQLRRDFFPYPALLQDPRSIFPITLPAAPSALGRPE
ncbi:MAG: hypothetical protein JWQ43_1280 [Glaciihabitans sp.]|nr:hypothetical protein [Glaciihabitans sp.]